MMNSQAQTTKDTSIAYVHQAAPSLGAHIFKIVARVIVPKNSISGKLAEENFVSEAASIPRNICDEFNVDTTVVDGRNVFTISPKGKKSGKYVLYLHGGAYINNIFRQHWIFAATIVRETNCTLLMPDYPLAPSFTYTGAFAMLDAIYKDLLAKANAHDIILMGDSAGGGLALALAEKLSDEGTQQPDQVILLSPWLDVTMSNPEISEVQKKDVTLRANELVLAGEAWSGTTDTRNYLVSPINGTFAGLSGISVFIGTHDILVADCRKLKTMMTKQGIPLNYFEYPKLFHDWMMFVSLKESQKAISQVCSLITDEKR